MSIHFPETKREGEREANSLPNFRDKGRVLSERRDKREILDDFPRWKIVASSPRDNPSFRGSAFID